MSFPLASSLSGKLLSDPYFTFHLLFHIKSFILKPFFFLSHQKLRINLMIELLQDAGFTGILYHDPPHIHANIDPSIDHSK